MASLMSKLDAVNKMLESVWETPVSTLEIAGVASVAQAKRILEDISRSVQNRGWAFNTEDDLLLSPDVNGYIAIPSNALLIDPSGTDADVDAVQRGTYMYDRENHTFAFTRSVKFRLVTLLDFEDLPQVARTYIAVMAARVFRDKWLQVETSSTPSPEEFEALRNLEECEAETGDYNVMNGSYSVAAILQRD